MAIDHARAAVDLRCAAEFSRDYQQNLLRKTTLVHILQELGKGDVVTR